MIPSQQLQLAQLLKAAALDPATGGMAGATLGPLGTTMYGAMSGEIGRGLRAGGRALLEGAGGAVAGSLVGGLIAAATRAGGVSKLMLGRGFTGAGIAVGAGHGAYKSFKKTEKKDKDHKKRAAVADSQVLAEVTRRRTSKNWFKPVHVKREEVEDQEWNEARQHLEGKQ